MDSPNKKISKSIQTKIAALEKQAAVAHQQGNLHIACQLYQQVVELIPNIWGAHVNLGAVYLDQGNVEAAKACNEMAIKLAPTSPYVYNNMGAMCSRIHDYVSARRYFQQALAILPNDITILCNIACLPGTDTETKYDLLKRATRNIYHQCQLAINNNTAISFARIESNALVRYAETCQQLCQWNELEELKLIIDFVTREQLKQGIKTSVEPFMSQALTADMVLQKDIAINHSRYYNVPENLQYKHSRDKETSKLHIGYLSPQFNSHAIGLLMAPLFALHNRDDFVVHGYSITRDVGEHTEIIKNNFDEFHDLTQMSDEAAAQKINQDGIHVLIDLTGYTSDRRTKILGFRPAPIQCQYMGFMGTMGAEFIDYFICNKICVPEAMQQFFIEKLVYLPELSFATSGFANAECNLSRKDFNLPEDKIVFYCFSQSYRIDKQVFDCWLEILKQVPDSVLWLAEGLLPQAGRIRKYAQALHLITPDRLIFSGAGSISNNWRNKLADIALDTFLLSSGTGNVLNAWAGVPCITLAGDAPYKRIGASVLHSIGMDELIVATEKEYIALAVSLANNPVALQEIKDKISSTRVNMPLFAADKFIKYLDQAFITMWDRFASNKPIEVVDVVEDTPF